MIICHSLVTGNAKIIWFQHPKLSKVVATRQQSTGGPLAFSSCTSPDPSISRVWLKVPPTDSEMMYGTTPFKGPSRHATFSNVLRQEPSFPESPAVSTLGKSCVRKLLTKNEHKRLGCQSGASEVKHHKWFSSIIWGLLRNTKPPIVPAASVCCLSCMLTCLC